MVQISGMLPYRRRRFGHSVGRRICCFLVAFELIAWGPGFAPNCAAEPTLTLSLTRPQADGWWGVNGQANIGVGRIEASTNLLDWQPIATLHSGNFTFYDPQSAQIP